MGNRVKVEMLRDVSNYGRGTIVEVGNLIAEMWIDNGIAKLAEEEDELKIVKPTRVISINGELMMFKLTSDLQDETHKVSISLADNPPKSLLAQVIGSNGYIQYAANISFVRDINGRIATVVIQYDAPIAGTDILNIVITDK